MLTFAYYTVLLIIFYFFLKSVSIVDTTDVARQLLPHLGATTRKARSSNRSLVCGTDRLSVVADRRSEWRNGMAATG